jgi:hypothetical protein
VAQRFCVACATLRHSTLQGGADANDGTPEVGAVGALKARHTPQAQGCAIAPANDRSTPLIFPMSRRRETPADAGDLRLRRVDAVAGRKRILAATAVDTLHQ